MQEVESDWCTLKDIVDHDDNTAWFFNVPLYQRLYVWGDEQVATLLNDITDACERNDEQFFLGGILVVETTTEQDRRTRRRTFDLIDGQQRFTTLFLLSQSPGWRDELSDFGRVKRNGTVIPRLNFSIRPNINHYFEALIQNQQDELPTIEGTEFMQNARKSMSTFAAQKDMDPSGIHKVSQYIYQKVRFVCTEIPNRMDLNKLFEVINARGVQLQHHEILKARLLHAIPAEERQYHAALWNACADMGGFVDQTLRQGRGKPFETDMTALSQKGNLSCAACVRDLLARGQAQHKTDESQSGSYSLAEIAAGDHAKNIREEQSEGEQHSTTSIIGFPLFLLHVLRIWLCDNRLEDPERILDRDLTKIFEKSFFSAKTAKSPEQNAREFMDLVWTIRVLWDAKVIKWTEPESNPDNRSNRVHMLCRTSHSEKDENPGLALLQSMLYHTQENTTQYWLTPYLYFVYKKQAPQNRDCLRYLRHLDNYLVCAEVDESLIKHSRSFMEDTWRTEPLKDFATYLRSKRGVHFHHYWFYKLDFVLWLTARQTGTHETWRNFRFTSKNSVEHVSPQQHQPTDRNTVSPDNKDDFGNLVLLSRGMNSEYSNRPFNEKQKQFENSKGAGRIESLKMDLIYENPTWNDTVMTQHRESMLELLKQYFAEDMRPDPEATGHSLHQLPEA